MGFNSFNKMSFPDLDVSVSTFKFLTFSRYSEYSVPVVITIDKPLVINGL